MQKIYYLFSKTNNYEALSVCNNKDSIKTPLYQTGIYPIGTLLSKTVQFISLHKEDSNFSNTWYKVSERIFQEKPSSFSGILCNDRNALDALSLMMYNHENINPSKSPEQILKLLKVYLRYIEICQKNADYCTPDSLNMLHTQYGEIPPRSYIFFGDNTNDRESAEIFGFMESDLQKKPFIPTFTGKFSKSLFSKTKGKTPFTKTKWEPLMTPLYVYEINDVTDFFSASIKCIFEQKYILKKCLYCNDLFVTRHKSTKFCPKQDKDPSDKSCYDSHRLNRQLEREKSGSAKMHHSVRTMLSRKYGPSDNRCLNFLAESQKKRDQIKVGALTEEEYVKWLQTFYVHKYK